MFPLDLIKNFAEDLRVETSSKFVQRMNVYSRQKAGGVASAPSIPRVLAENKSCLMCAMKGTCLGSNCLGHRGKLLFKICNYCKIR